jgi:hypothetical protein
MNGFFFSKFSNLGFKYYQQVASNWYNVKIKYNYFPQMQKQNKNQSFIASWNIKYQSSK